MREINAGEYAHAGQHVAARLAYAARGIPGRHRRPEREPRAHLTFPTNDAGSSRRFLIRQKGRYDRLYLVFRPFNIGDGSMEPPFATPREDEIPFRRSWNGRATIGRDDCCAPGLARSRRERQINAAIARRVSRPARSEINAGQFEKARC